MNWELKKLGWRGVEVGFTAAMYAWGWFFPDPIILDGPDSVKRLPAEIKKKKIDKVLVVTDKGLMGLHLLDGLFEELDKAGVGYVIYDETQPNPTINNVEDAKKLYLDNDCQGIVAFGGGSPMDCAKIAGARVARPNRPVAKMSGVFMVVLPTIKKMGRLIPPPLFAVPTTAGTGSETTIAAVITDPDTHDKFAVMDPFIRARYAVLDPNLTVGLPKHITSTTGMDALTHAIEGYTNIWYNNKKFNDYGVKAVKLIFKYLERAYNDGTDIEARGQLLLASYYAGMCFTRGGVGFVHGIGHRLGGLYGVPHGLAMSVILPHVMSDELLAPHVYDKLADLADAVGITGATPEAKAKAFIAEVRAMNERMGIPTGFDCIKEEDIPLIAERAIAEVCPTYPVPHFFKQEELEKFIKENLMLK